MLPWPRRARLVLLAGLLAAACSRAAPPAPLTTVPPSPAPPLPADAGLAPCTGAEPTSPSEFGACDLQNAQYEVASAEPVNVLTVASAAAQAALATADVAIASSPESYAVFSSAGATYVVGRDEVGAMYGAFELAERLRAAGASLLPLAAPVTGTPHVALRAANHFLVLPADNEPFWWFYDTGFWSEYLGLLAHARFDFLDLHGMYNLDNTIFPNALLYFARSATLPDVGVPAATQAKNLAMLDTVIAMARARGIQVGLMSYTTGTDPLGSATTLSDADLQIYTREAAQYLATNAVGLSRLGFRIGESGRPASWYVGTFVAGVQAADAGVQLSTRTWLSSKPDILSIAAAASPSLIVEAKYNGEHLGAPYAIEGALFSQIGSYSYEDYLDPATPYRFVFQIRAGGTHRIFRQASLERARRTILSLGFSPRVAGFTLEPPHAYFPQRDYYHASPADSFSPWTFRRDELFYLLFGRLGYDPTLDEAPFRAALAARLGTDGLWDSVQAASEVVPWIQTAHECGPDSRDFAPELEWGGPVSYWASPSNAPVVASACARTHQPFDGFSYALPFEVATDLASGTPTTRVSPVEAARRVLLAAGAARAASQVATDPSNAEARDVVRECTALADLGEYFGHKLRGASALAVYAQTGHGDYLSAARSETALADAAWGALSTDTAYIAPFQELLRMGPLGWPLFHWRDEVATVATDAPSIDAVAAATAAHPPAFAGPLPAAAAWLAAQRDPGPGLVSLVVTPADPVAPSWAVRATLGAALPVGATANVLWKPFDSTVDWTSVPAVVSGADVSATVRGDGRGGLFALELIQPGRPNGWRYPDALTGAPYLSVPP